MSLFAQLRSSSLARRARAATEHAVTPNVRVELVRLTAEVTALRAAVDAVEAGMPILLAAVSESNGKIELLRADLQARGRLDDAEVTAPDPPR